MQKLTLPKIEISIFEKLGFGKMRNRDTKTKILIFKVNLDLGKVRNRHLKSKIRLRFFLLAKNLISKTSKSISLISLEFRFQTPKFEIAVVENPKILIFASKFKFFFDQNLDFVLGYHRECFLQQHRELHEVNEFDKSLQKKSAKVSAKVSSDPG